MFFNPEQFGIPGKKLAFHFNVDGNILETEL